MPRRKYNNGIKCPICGGYTTDVIKSAPASGHVLRHRRCHKASCSGEVTTIERPVGETPESLAESIGNLLHGQFRDFAEKLAIRSSEKM